MCFSTAPSVTTSFRAIAAFVRPSAISPSTSRSRGVNVASGSRPTPGEQLGHDLRVEHRPAGGHPLQRVGKIIERADAILEEVADAASPVGEQIAGVGLLDVLREHEHGRAWHLAAGLDRGPQALVGVRRRHPHVDDRDVRAVLDDGGHQRVAVPDRRHDRAAGLVEQPDQPLAQQHRVVREDDSELCWLWTSPSQSGRPAGTSANTMVGPPGGLSTLTRPSSAAARSTRPARPWPLPTCAPPRPSSTTHARTTSADAGQTGRLVALDGHAALRRLGVLRHVGQ